jgi:LPXTG-site transpeptidase (sortase) family protein
MTESPGPLLRPLMSTFLVLALTGTVAGCVLLLVTPDDYPRQSSAAEQTVSPVASPEASPAAVAEPEQAAAPAEPSSAPSAVLGRVVIPKIGVDAPLVAKGIDGGGRMEVPDDPEQVAWYYFTAWPGEEGNTVLSGHVDYRGYGPAVFARLRDLTVGDVVEVWSEDGGTHQYVVTQSVAYEAEGAPIEEIVGPTGRETVTLITCDGTFNGGSVGYSHRLVVRAERL